MRFAFTGDQALFRDALRDVLASACPPSAVRARWDADGALDPALWSQLSELGVTGLLVPERWGGMGLAPVDLAPLIEEAGYAALPAPLSETAAVAAPLLAAAGGALAERWLPAIASGEARVALGLATDAHVVGADQASLLLLERGGALYAVAPGDARLERRTAVDRTRRLFAVDFEPRPEDRLGAGEDAGMDLAALALDLSAAASAASLNGLSRRMLDMAVDYAAVREQFGQPIGAFQAVQHHLADALMHLEFARPTAWQAAWTLSHAARPDRAVHASLAKARASDAADQVSRKALQVHGAIGYTTECDLHLWLKRAWALRRQHGDAAWHRARIAERLLATPALES